MRIDGYYSFDDLKKKLGFQKHTAMAYRKQYGLPHVKFGRSYYYPVKETNEFFGIDLQQYNFITKKELMKKYNISEKTVWNWAERGLPHIQPKKDNFYPVELVEKWIEEQMKDGEGT